MGGQLPVALLCRSGKGWHLQRLQSGRPGYRALWQHFFNVSKIGLDREFASLGIHFDLWKGEASVDPITGPMIEDFKSRGVAIESEGALVIPVERNTDKKEMPPLILVKSDGAVLYGTTDLATIGTVLDAPEDVLLRLSGAMVEMA